MATNIVDDKILQRLLFVTSDLIGNALDELSTDSGSSIIKLKANPVSNSEKIYLNQKEQITALRRQQELFSDTSIPTGLSAWELFKDNYSNVPIDTSYVISNYILMYFGTTPYFFNIDQVNSSNSKIYISKLAIKNKSKDAFTLKSNYHLTLKINFTSFDDLLTPTIFAKNALNPGTGINIAPMHLLYKFFDQNFGSQKNKHAQDPTGIFLNQTLTLDEKDARYSDLRDKLSTNVLSKNYHLTYYKHNIDMFKGEDPIFKYFENELTIEYVAYEADGEDKPMTEDLKKIIPKVNGNIFNLLNERILEGTDISRPDLLGGQRKDANGNIITSQAIYSLREIFEQLQMNQKDIELWQKQLGCGSESEIGKQREGIENSLKAANEKNVYLKTYANRILVFTILRLCRMYRIRIPYSLIGTYERGQFAELFFNQFFSAGFLAEIAGTAGFAALSGATLATGGAAVGGAIALYALTAAVTAYTASKEVVTDKFNFTQTRSVIAKITADGFNNSSGRLTTEPKDKYLQLAYGSNDKFKEYAAANAADTDISSRNDFKTMNGTSKEASEKIKKMLERMGQIEVPDRQDGLDAVIYFTTFGEIMKVLKRVDPSDALKIISGGYIINIDPVTAEAAHVNFANLPITINALTKFLYNNIELGDKSLNYDSELFFRDCYENLVKAIISDGQTVLPSIQNAAPRNIKVISTIHKQQANDSWSWFKNTNLLDEAKFNDLKFNFLKTKNFNLTSGGMNSTSKMMKVYVIGTFDEIKYYNFYESYNEWSTKYNKPNRRLYNCDQFQEFINREHLIPCLLMKQVSDSESILKKKYVQFSRIDNPNLNTGNFLNSSGLVRYPYQFTADFKAHMAFFSDIGSLMFIAPPSSTAENALYGQVNMFGFGGLYIIKSAELEYSFQRIQDGKLTIPNLESKYKLEGYMLTHGDSIRSLEEDKADATKKEDNCGDPNPVSKEPSYNYTAAKQGIF